MSAAPSAVAEIPATIQELAAHVIQIVRHHERNCGHCAPMPCVECEHCRMVMEDDVLRALRLVNKRSR